MSRRARTVWPGCPFHIVQKANHSDPIFESDSDFAAYRNLLKRGLPASATRLLAFAVMNNHVHLILLPEFGDSLSRLMRALAGSYARYFNTTRAEKGRVWQDRYYSTPMSPRHLHHALRYVELNPVRAGIAKIATDSPWTSARAHHSGIDPTGILDMQFFHSRGGTEAWRRMIEYRDTREAEINHFLRSCTYAERPFGDTKFVEEAERRFGCHFKRWPFDQSLESSDTSYHLDNLIPYLPIEKAAAGI
jgi:putative transposase